MASRIYHLRRRHRTPRKKSSFMSFIASVAGTFLAVILLSGLLVGGIAFGVYAYVAQDLVPIETIVTRDVARSTQILDRKGRLLYEIFDPKFGRRTTVPLREISPYLIQATIATEDASFYENSGINFRGILRALYDNIRQGEVVGGGSSITQQLVKNVYIPEEERSSLSVLRKLREAILSIELTRRFSKDQILEYYLNENNYGNLSYGIEAAAQSYFGKTARDLDLAEASLLAGIPQAPARYSPLLNPGPAKERQIAVLDIMVRQNFVSKAEAEAAKTQKLEYETPTFDIKAPHFVIYIRELLAERYGARALYRDGLQVTTTLDLDMQELAEKIVRKHVAVTSETINGHNSALVAIDPRSGEILTMVGSVNYFDSSIDGQVNLATAERQPGSSFKPFTYVTAFSMGYSPSTMLLDIPLTIDDGINEPHEVQNFDEKLRGPVSIRQALSNSMNIPAMKTIMFTSVRAVLDTAHKMGITSLNRQGWYGPSLTLGAGEVKLLDMTYAYSVFANRGKMAGVPVLPEKQLPNHRTLDPVAILKIEDINGNIKEEFTVAQKRQIISPELAYLITSILSDRETRAPIFGNTLDLPDLRPAAIKTGTTEFLSDFWQMGYTPDLAVGVWMGNSDNSELTDGFSGTTAGPIWKEFVATVLEGTAHSAFVRPPGIVSAEVCVPSGLLPTDKCEKTASDIFIRGTIPRERDNLYTTVKIDKVTGQLAAPNTPPEEIEEKIFLVLPEEAREWAKEHEFEQPPEEVSARQPTPTPTPTPTPSPTPTPFGAPPPFRVFPTPTPTPVGGRLLPNPSPTPTATPNAQAPSTPPVGGTPTPEPGESVPS